MFVVNTMANRIQNDGNAYFEPLQSTSQAYAKLGPSTVPSDAELPSIVIPSVATTMSKNDATVKQGSSIDYNIVKIKLYNAQLGDIEERQKELNKIREKLFSWLKNLSNQNHDNSNVKLQSHNFTTMGSKKLEVLPEIKLLGSTLHNPDNGNQEITSQNVTSAQEAIVNRITTALNTVDSIQSQLQTQHVKATDLLVLSSSIDGLNYLQSSVNIEPSNMAVASQICDRIIQNASLALVAQGNVTPDLANLAIS
jgi:hypothetical protein